MTGTARDTARSTEHHVQASVEIDADPGDVFDLLADPVAAPRLSPTVVHVERVAGDDHADVVARWVFDGTGMRTWRAHRELDRAAGTIGFGHGEPPPGVVSMRGRWTLRSDGGARTTAHLRHDWTASPEADPAATAAMLDTGARRQLAGLRRYAETGAVTAAHELVEQSSVWVPIGVQAAVDFLLAPRLWEFTVPRCRGAERSQLGADHQVVAFALEGADPGVRCYVAPTPDRVVWRQTDGLPAGYRALRGAFAVTAGPDESATVTSTTTHGLDPDVLAERGGDPAAWRALARSAVDLDLLDALEHFAIASS